MPKRRTHEEFIKEIYDLVGDEYTVLSKFTGVDNKVKFRHNTNGNEFMMTPYHFINRGQRDPDKSEIAKRIKDKERKGNKYFTDKLNGKYGDRYKLVSNYVNMKVKVTIWDNVDEKYITTLPGSFLQGYTSSNNNLENRGNPKTHEEFVQEVYNLVKNKYSVVSRYTKSNIKVRFRNNLTGFEWEATPSSFLSGHREPIGKLTGRSRIPTTNYVSLDELEARIYNMHGDKIKIKKDTYTTMGRKATFINTITKETWQATPTTILAGAIGPNNKKGSRIASKTLARRQNEFKEKLSKVWGNTFEPLEPYTARKTPIRFYDHEHREEVVIKPDNLLRGFGNPNYKSNKKKTTEEFKQEVYDLVGDEYSVLSDYIQAYDKVKFRHNTNNNTFEMTPHNFLRGQRDPLVTQPKGETEIIKILEDRGIKYEYQHVLPHKGARVNGLRPDFYLPEYNTFIEFDGQQHFFPINLFGGQESYDKQVVKDARKNAYAYEHGIKMVRVHYSFLGHIEEFLQPFFDRNDKVDNVDTFVV